MEKAEARAQRLAMGFDRLPDGLVPRVVVDDEHFKFGVIKPGERVQCLDQHVRRFVVCGYVH